MAAKNTAPADEPALSPQDVAELRDVSPGGNAREWSAEEIAEAKHQKAFRADYGPYPRCEICAEYVEPELYSQHVNAHMGRGAGALGAGLPDDD